MEKCRAVTSKNERCKRTPILGRSYCWQHESSWFKISFLSLIGSAAFIIALWADLVSLGVSLPTIKQIIGLLSTTPEPIVVPDDLIKITSYFDGGCTARMTPLTIQSNYRPETLSSIAYAKESRSYLQWPTLPIWNTDVIFNLTSAAGNDKSWLIFDARAFIKIISYTELNYASYVEMDGCGQGGITRLNFNTVTLNNRVSQYTSQIDNVDAISLMPGEAVSIHIPFNCKEPGLYKVSIELPLSYEDTSGLFSLIEELTIPCPEHATYWTIMENYESNSNKFDIVGLNLIHEYEFSNGKYEPQ